MATAFIIIEVDKWNTLINSNLACVDMGCSCAFLTKIQFSSKKMLPVGDAYAFSGVRNTGEAI
jgi:hypothetical protein